MSTRSYVGIQKKGSDDVKYIYVHFDGYVEGVGKALKENFTDPDLIEAIIDEGARRTWVPSTNVGQEDEVYGDESFHTKSREDLIAEFSRSFGIDYLYIFSEDDGTWSAYGYDEKREFKELDF